MATNWKKLYGPTLAVPTSAVVIYTAATQTAVIITKFTISNVTGTAALATISIGGVQVYQRSIPGYPVNGGITEVVELEGHELSAGDAITFTAGTASALAPYLSGVEYQP